MSCLKFRSFVKQKLTLKGAKKPNFNVILLPRQFLFYNQKREHNYHKRKLVQSSKTRGRVLISISNEPLVAVWKH